MIHSLHSVETCPKIYIRIFTNRSSNRTHQIRHVANVSIILIDNCCSNCCCQTRNWCNIFNLCTRWLGGRGGGMGGFACENSSKTISWNVARVSTCGCESSWDGIQQIHALYGECRLYRDLTLASVAAPPSPAAAAAAAPSRALLHNPQLAESDGNFYDKQFQLLAAFCCNWLYCH